MNEIYIIFSLLIVFSTFMTINSLNPIHSMFWLVLMFLFSSGLLILFNLEFLPLIIIIMYVGAMAILFLFVIMMLDMIQLKKIQNMNNMIPSIIMIFNMILMKLWIIKLPNFNVYSKMNYYDFNFNYKSQINNMANLLYSDYWIPFIFMSMLLLMAMMGAMVLNLETNKLTKNQFLFKQHQSNNSWI